MKAEDIKIKTLYKDDCTGKFRYVTVLGTGSVVYEEFFPGTPYAFPVVGSCTQEAFAQWASREAYPEELRGQKGPWSVPDEVPPDAPTTC